MGEILLGTSGWSYEEWVGPFYEKKKNMLGHYSKVFGTAEINSTFYSLPPEWMTKLWAKRAPEGFEFAAKVPKSITHKKKLVGIDRELGVFLDLMAPLKEAGSLGPLLVQLPPSLEFDRNVLEGFLEQFSDTHKFAIEFRHLSWVRDETRELLGKFNTAYTVVDEPLMPPDAIVTADFAYVRWHGRGKRPWYDYCYNREELEQWVPKMKELAFKGKVYGYFNNHFKAFAPRNALEMGEMLGLQMKPKAVEAKSRLENWFAQVPAEPGIVPSPISSPKGPLTELSFEELLQALIDRRRYKRALKIPDSALKIEESGPQAIRARVKNYKVEIDVGGKSILHDCADWGRVSVKKQFCKHMGKLFLSLPEDLAEEVLREILEEKDQWKFRPMTG